MPRARRRRAPDGYVASLRDVSGRKAAEAALRLSEARYRALADALPQLVWIAGLETGDATYVNRRFADYYGPIGPSRAARIARNHPDDAERMERWWSEARTRHDACEVEGRLRRHDGAYRWHKLVLLPIRQGETLIGMLGTALDIDEIVTARRAVEEASSLLLLAQKAADAGTWHLDVDSGHIDWSPGSARLHGIETDREYRIDTRTWLTLIDREDGARALRTAAAAAETAGHLHHRVPGPDPGGRDALDQRGRPRLLRAGRPDAADAGPQHRRDRPQGRGGGADRRQGRGRGRAPGGRARERGQDRLPGRHEPRDPHAAQRA